MPPAIPATSPTQTSSQPNQIDPNNPLAGIIPAFQALAPVSPKWHDVKIRVNKTIERARVAAVPPEEFGISRMAREMRTSNSWSTGCNYCFHETIRAEADLIAEGYDELQIRAIPSYTGLTNIETQQRDTVEERTGSQGAEALNRAIRMVRVTEHYIRMDYMQNGDPRIYRVTTGGETGQILSRNGKDEIVEQDVFPFATITPFPQTHRFFGRSVADSVIDIQRIKTALVRGMLDNLYAHNNPRPVVAASGATPETMDDLSIIRHGQPIRVQSPDAIEWQTVPDITGAIFPALQYFDATREWRTGVTRQGQGVDPNALQNQVATIANQMQEVSVQKIKMIARVFAETGIRDLFYLLHATIRKHGSQPQTVRLRNKWVEVDPRNWRERNDLTVSVGLGTGTRQQQLVELQMLIGAQTQAVQAGIVSKRNLFNTAKDMVRQLRPGADVNTYFSDPANPGNPQDPASQPIQVPPDPKHAQAQQQLQVEQMRQQGEQQKMGMQAQLKQTEIQADAAHQAMKTQGEQDLAERKFALEREMAVLQAQLKEREQLHEMQLREIEHQHAMALKEREAAAKETAASTPKASIEIKHGADEITEPLSRVITQFGDHLAQTHQKSLDALHETVKQLSKPRKTVIHRDPKTNRATHATSEAV